MNQYISKIITIDGPAGAGKSTLARNLAHVLTWIYLDTGAIYRAIALATIRQGIDPSDQKTVENMAEKLKLSVLPKPDKTAILLEDEDVTDFLRSQEVSHKASLISAWPGVRQVLLSLQRSQGKKGEIVVEGRDMGTVVFPEAGLKFFIDATPEIRAKRRYLELMGKGVETNLPKVLEDIVSRDQADKTREISPLKVAPGAVTIDTTNLEPEAVLKVMVNSFRNKFMSPNSGE